MNLKLRRITIAEIEAFALELEASDYEVIPITTPRAVSQARNPKALPNDVVLTVAYDDKNSIIGYIGALPDRVGNTRCAWNSCWWVKPGASPDIPLKLFFSFLSDWDHRVIFSEMTPRTSVLIKKLNFCTHKNIIGIRGYYRFCLTEVLPSKVTWVKHITLFLFFFDYVANVFVALHSFLFRKAAYKSFDFEIETIEYPSADDDPFIERMNRNQPAKRYAIDFEWIARFPWVVNHAITNRKSADRYYFTYGAERFESKWVRFSDNGQLVGLVAYTIRDHHLKLQYVFVEDSAINKVGAFFYHILLSDKSIYSITTFHSGIKKYLNDSKHFIYKTNLPKLSAQSNKLIELTGSIDFVLQMGDGDCIFT